MPTSSVMKTTLLAALIIACFGCADSRLITRAVQDGPSLFVGLSSYNNPENFTEVRHQHPMDWSESALRAILTGLFIQKRGGLMDASKLPEAIFSPEDMVHITSALRETFKIARPSDWIVFALWGASQPSQTLEVTSGGMFLKDQRLHIILANHRERVSSEKEGIKGIRDNPLRSLRDVRIGQLVFDPAKYMIDSRDNWLAGGYESPVSELILNLQALLAANRPTISADPQKGTAAKSSKTDSAAGLSTESEVRMLREEISNLKEELSRLQHLITQQAEELSREKNP